MTYPGLTDKSSHEHTTLDEQEQATRMWSTVETELPLSFCRDQIKHEHQLTHHPIDSKQTYQQASMQ